MGLQEGAGWLPSAPPQPRLPPPVPRGPPVPMVKTSLELIWKLSSYEVGQSKNGPPAWLAEYWNKYSVGNTEVVGSNTGNLVGGSNMGNQGNLGNYGSLGSLGNILGSSEGTESRQNYWAPSFGNWPTHTVSKSSIFPTAHQLRPTGGQCVFFMFLLRPGQCEHIRGSCHPTG